MDTQDNTEAPLLILTLISVNYNNNLFNSKDTKKVSTQKMIKIVVKFSPREKRYKQQSFHSISFYTQL